MNVSLHRLLDFLTAVRVAGPVQVLETGILPQNNVFTLKTTPRKKRLKKKIRKPSKLA